jgi:hypothetical protein
MVRPDLQNTTQDLVAVAPGHWQGRIGGTTVGTYLLHGVLRKNGQVLGQADRAVSVPYSPEYLQLGRDDGLLRQVARDGGGAVLAKAAAAWTQRPLPVPVSSGRCCSWRRCCGRSTSPPGASRSARASCT